MTLKHFNFEFDPVHPCPFFSRWAEDLAPRATTLSQIRSIATESSEVIATQPYPGFAHGSEGVLARRSRVAT